MSGVVAVSRVVLRIGERGAVAFGGVWVGVEDFGGDHPGAIASGRGQVEELADVSGGHQLCVDEHGDQGHTGHLQNGGGVERQGQGPFQQHLSEDQASTLTEKEK